MALRFRRTVKIAPGVRLNVTKTGISARVGPRGAGVTVGTSGTTVSAGIPGTGLHASRKLTRQAGPGPGDPPSSATGTPRQRRLPGVMGWLVIAAVAGYVAWLMI